MAAQTVHKWAGFGIWYQTGSVARLPVSFWWCCCFVCRRYGGGLNKDGTAFNDPNVTLSYVYLAAKHYTPGWSILDLYGFFAFVGGILAPAPGTQLMRPCSCWSFAQ